MGSRRRAWRWTQRRQPRQCQALQSVEKSKHANAVTAIITEIVQLKGYLPVSDAGSITGIIAENI